MASASREAMLRLERGGRRGAAPVLALLARRDEVAAALRLARRLSAVAAAVLLGVLAYGLFGAPGVTAVVLGVAAAGQAAAARLSALAAAAAERTLLLAAPLLSTANALLGPPALLLERGWSAATPPPHPPQERVHAARDQLRGVVERLHRSGEIEKLDRDMLDGVLRLRQLTVSDVMVHRTEMITVDADDPPESVLRTVIDAPVTRLPLWRGSPENIVGVLHVKAPRAERWRASTFRRSRAPPGSCPTRARSPTSSGRSAGARTTSPSSSTNTAR
jgi:Mg2+/Co2+ transporter CorB